MCRGLNRLYQCFVCSDSNWHDYFRKCNVAMCRLGALLSLTTTLWELGRWRWANIWNTLRLLLPSRITSCRSWHHPTALQKATLLLRQKTAEIGDATAILAYPWDTSGWSRGAVCSQPWHVIRRPLPSFGLGGAAPGITAGVRWCKKALVEPSSLEGLGRWCKGWP